MAVGQLAEAPNRPELHPLLARRPEADQGPDRRAEGERLVGIEVAALDRLDHTVLRLADGEEVDEPNDVAVAQALELGPDLPVELGVLEGDDEDLDRADRSWAEPTAEPVRLARLELRVVAPTGGRGIAPGPVEERRLRWPTFAASPRHA